MRSRVTENCRPTSSSVWSLFTPMPKRMRIMRSSRGVLGLGLGGDLRLNFDQLAALAFGLFVGLLARLLALFARLLGLDHVDAHLAEHGQHILDLLGIDLL